MARELLLTRPKRKHVTGTRVQFNVVEGLIEEVVDAQLECTVPSSRSEVAVSMRSGVCVFPSRRRSVPELQSVQVRHQVMTIRGPDRARAPLERLSRW